jgi:phage shock protein E
MLIDYLQREGRFMRTITQIMALVLGGFLSIPWLTSRIHGAEKIEHTMDSLETVKKNLDEKKAVLLDVREKKEWDEGHLQQAVLVPLSKLKEGTDPKTLLKDLDPKTIVYCHCRAGARAVTAAEILKKKGYDVRPLKPGYEELLKGGLPKSK